MSIKDLVLYVVCAFLVPLLVSWEVCPMVVKLAKQKNLTDCPGNRKLQKKPVPVVGGVSVFTALIISLSLFYLFNTQMSFRLYIDACCVVAFAMIFLVGFFDDMVDLPAGTKFVFQFLTIGLLFCAGYRIDGFNGLFGVEQLPWLLSLAISLVAGVGIMNAVNMIDGVNGLSSSVGINFSFVCAVLLIIIGDYSNAGVALVFMSSLIPFFIANAFSLKYKMFIGDSGALMLGTLGYMLVCSLLQGVRSGAVGQATCSHSVALAVAIFAMPVFDTLRVMTMRTLRGRSPFSADKTHLHHILLELKVSHLAVTFGIGLLGLIVFCSWLITNWLVEAAWLQLLIVVAMAALCSWGTYAYLARCRDKKDVKFQGMIYALANMSTRIRVFRRKVEGAYDGYMDRKGYSVPEFDVERVDVAQMLERLGRFGNNKLNNMEYTDYHAIDQEKILKYIASFAEVKVDDIIAQAGAEKLRVYPILFELEQAGVIAVRQRTPLGAPVMVTLIER